MKGFRVRGLAAAAVLAAGTCAAQAQQFTMKVSTPTINDVAHEYLKTMKAGIEKSSGGRIKVEVYPANQLGQIPATIEGVTLGTIELTFPAIGFFVGLDPRFLTLDAGGLFDGVVHGQKVVADPDIRKRLSTFGEAKGVEPLTFLFNGPMMLASHKPVRAVADLNGLKLRMPGAAPLYVEPFKKMGVSPVVMSVGEMLPAMQNKAIDGVITAFAIINGFKYYDVSKSATHLPQTFAIAAALVNRKYMKSLGAELEGIVRAEAQKAEVVFSTWGVEDVARIRANWEKNGGEFITMSAPEAKKYVDITTSVIPDTILKSPQMKADYEALLAAAKKYR